MSLAGSASNRDVLIYVHGFNTSLEEARFRLAQLVVDAKFGGVAVLFTWPSKAALLAYGADKESATASRDAYLNLLNDLADTPGIGRIHILAHSMGTWLTMETLRGEALAGSPDLHGKLGNVMLAAPDIDLSVFKQQISQLDPSHFSVYVSKDDRALQVSASIQGDRRLGSLDPVPTTTATSSKRSGSASMTFPISATNLIGHDNYTNAPQVVRQIGKRRRAARRHAGRDRRRRRPHAAPAGRRSPPATCRLPIRRPWSRRRRPRGKNNFPPCPSGSRAEHHTGFGGRPIVIVVSHSMEKMETPTSSGRCPDGR